MVIKFDPDKIQAYSNNLAEKNSFCKERSFSINAILSIFDKDANGIISQKEFDAVSEKDYNTFVEELCKHNKEQGNDEQYNSIPSYKKLISFIKNRSYIRISQLENFEINQGNENNVYNDMSDKHFKETKHLKDISQMSEEEIINELTSYGIPIQNNKKSALKRALESAREQRILSDENSSVVDGHIGTYIQPEGNKSCTILAHLDTLTDEEVQNMYKKRIDNDGNVVYDVTLTKDNGEKVTVTVTEKEIYDGEIEINEDGIKKTISNFTSGDADVRMFEMAYVKAMGSEITQLGEWAYKTQNRLNNTNSTFSYRQDLEKIKDFSTIPRNSIISLLDEDERKQKNLPDSITFAKENGENVELKMTPFGLRITQNGSTIDVAPAHAIQIKGYNKEDNTLTISGNNFENMSELKIPAYPEVLAYFELDTIYGKPFGI